MPKQCPNCAQIFPDFVDFCVADGRRLTWVVAGEPEVAEQVPPDQAETSDFSAVGAFPRPRARLFAKVKGEIQSLGVEFRGDVVLGRFDPELGPVDVDLGELSGGEHVAPRHAALSYREGVWFVRCLGSEDGVFVGGGPRISEEVPLENGIELGLGKAIFVFEVVQPRESA